MNEITSATVGQTPRSRYEPWHFCLIAIVCLVVYLSGNGRVSLWDRDEAWYSQTAREMVRRGDYVVPMFNGEPRLRKPVLIYWLMAAAYSMLGDNEYGARFVSGLAGTITCLLTYRLGTRLMGRPVGLVASLMLAVAPFMVAESKLATTDALLTAVLTGAFSCVWELYIGGFSWRWSLAFWSLIGVAILAKGPFGPAFLGLALLAWLMLSRQWSLLRRMNWGVGVCIVLAICLPWGIAIHIATGGEFYRVALGEQALGHSLSSMNAHRGFPGYYLVLALVGLLPWTFALSMAFSGFRRWIRDTGPESFLVGWMIGPMVLLEIMRTKLPQYYLPGFPAWALLIARGMVEFHLSARCLVQTAAGKRRMVVIGGVGMIGAVAILTAALSRLPAELRAPAIVLAATLAAGTVAILVALSQRYDRVAWGIAVGTWGSMALLGGAWLLPSAESCRVTRAAGEALRAEAATGAPVVLFGFREPSLVFYVQQPTATFDSAAELALFLREHGPSVTLLRDTDLGKLRKEQDIVVETGRRIEANRIKGLPALSVAVTRLSLRSNSESEAALNREMPRGTTRR